MYTLIFTAMYTVKRLCQALVFFGCNILDESRYCCAAESIRSPFTKASTRGSGSLGGENNTGHWPDNAGDSALSKTGQFPHGSPNRAAWAQETAGRARRNPLARLSRRDA